MVQKISEKFSLLFDLLIYGKFFLYGKIYPGFKPKKTDLVIDLGSGDKPFWRADVYLDKLSLGDEQRFTDSAVKKEVGIFVDSDITKTPFKNKAFDFSYCSHVLEHLDSPDLAIKEIMRISKAGYIEIPDGMSEIIFPFHSHLWFIFQQNGTLVFVRKSKTWHNVLWNNGSKYKFFNRFTKSPFIQLYWKNKIKYKIIDDVKRRKNINQ